MAYIWQNYSVENYYYIPKCKQSYYEEIWRTCEKHIPVNIFNRFNDIFYPEELIEKPEILGEIEKKYKFDDKYRDIVNLIIHQLIYFDRLRGVTLDDIKMSLIYDEINDLLWGENISDMVSRLEFGDLFIVLYEFVKKQTSMVTLYDEVLHMLFGKVIVYKEKSSDITIVYIERIRNSYRENLYSIVEFLFADLELDLEVIWANEHFGVIGNLSTMKIDKLSIY